MAVSSGLSLSPDLGLRRSLWQPSWPLAFALVMFVCLARGNGLPLLGDPDSHWHIAVGNWILAHGRVPYFDFYSFTFTGQPWIAKEWLSQVLLAGAYDAGGWGGVVVLGAAAFAASFAVLIRLLLRDLRPVPALMFAGTAVVLMAPHFLARPHALAFPFMLLWVDGLVRAVEERRAPRPILLLCRPRPRPWRPRLRLDLLRLRSEFRSRLLLPRRRLPPIRRWRSGRRLPLLLLLLRLLSRLLLLLLLRAPSDPASRPVRIGCSGRGPAPTDEVRPGRCRPTRRRPPRPLPPRR